MASAGSIFVDLFLRDAQYRQGLKRANKSTSDFAKGVKQLARELGPLIGGAGFGAIINSALKSADAISKAAKAVGLSTDQFQKLGYAFRLGGIDSETFTNALIKLNNNLAQGKLPYADTQSALLGIADKLKNAKDGIDRTRIASDAFGSKLGAKLIPALLDGSTNLVELGREAEKLGLVFGGDLIRNAENFKDQIEILGDVATKNFQGGLLSQFVTDSESIRNIYTDPNFIEGVRGLGQVFGQVAQAMLAIGQVLGGVVTGIRSFLDASQDLGNKVGNFLQNRGFTNNPNVSFSRPNTVNEATRDPGAIDAALKARGLRGLLNDSQVILKEINTEIDSTLVNLSQQTELLALQNDHFGENQHDIEAIVDLRKIELDLAEKGIILSGKRRENIQAELNDLAIEKKLQDELKEAEQSRIELQEEMQRQQEENIRILEESVQQIRGDLAGGLKDVLFGAKNIADAFKDVALRIAEAVVEAQLLKLITEATGGGSGGNSIGGIGFFAGLGRLFGLPSFDVGSPRVPQDTLAMVHRDEMIIPAAQANSIRSGGGMGGGITMNVYTPNADSFRASDRQIARQLRSRVATA